MMRPALALLLCFTSLPVLAQSRTGSTSKVSNGPAAAPTVKQEGSTCIEREGKSACGFHCLAGTEDVACANTAQGNCLLHEGKVTCWDPPFAYLTLSGVEFPTATCTRNFGKVACGFGCVEHGSEVKCASTPWGRCAGNYGKVVCWDPPAGLVAQLGGKLPKPQCVEHSGQLACGYNCLANEGRVGCSNTPQGRCSESGGKITCWDPPVSTMTPSVMADCIESDGNRACGYHCLHHKGQVACAATPAGSCAVVGDRLECRD